MQPLTWLCSVWLNCRLVDMRDVVYNVFNRVSNAVYTKV